MEWTETIEQMPDTYDWYLVSLRTDTGKMITIMGFLDTCSENDNGSIWLISGGDVEHSDVTHWMPLPEPPTSTIEDG